MIRNSDIINRMERNGDYGASSDFKDSLREHGHSESDWADRYNPADGAQYSYAGDRAEKAYEDIRREERNREEQRREEEYYAAQEYARDRQQISEEEYYEQQEQEQD
jgi:hypothetical protein